MTGPARVEVGRLRLPATVDTVTTVGRRLLADHPDVRAHTAADRVGVRWLIFTDPTDRSTP